MQLTDLSLLSRQHGHSSAVAMRVPRLLVSVRNIAEARAAIDGGCDILDVKEPANGSLGRAPLTEILAVARFAASAGIPCSAALGELSEWHDGAAVQARAEPRGDVLPEFLKLGLARLGSDADWLSQWKIGVDRIRDSIFNNAPGSSRCVAVIYADWRFANSPEPERLLDAIADEDDEFGSRIAGVLVDTYSKSSGTLLDVVSMNELHGIAARTHTSGRFLALAGRINDAILEPLCELSPDIIAIRSAACVGTDRTADVDRKSVERFRAEMQRVFLESGNHLIPA